MRIGRAEREACEIALATRHFNHQFALPSALSCSATRLRNSFTTLLAAELNNC
jgi:hypothetical protein